MDTHTYVNNWYGDGFLCLVLFRCYSKLCFFPVFHDPYVSYFYCFLAIMYVLFRIPGFDTSKIFKNEEENTCPPDKTRGVFVARTEYNILMHDSNNENHKWNVTFFDYTSLAMGKEMLNDYGMYNDV